MKSPDQAAFKVILIITMIIAVALLPVVAKAGQHKPHGPPAFSEIDADGDGKVNEAELTTAQQAHHQAMHGKHGKGEGMGMHHGKDMKMPTFSDLDLDGNGCINADEFVKHQAEMHGKRQAPAE